MVFKKGHKPANKKGTPDKKVSNDISDIYVKFGVKAEMKNNLSNLAYMIATLKKDLGIIDNLRVKKAFLRKELYETLVSLRLNMDSMENHMPSKEFEALKKKLEEINRYAKKEAAKKPEVKKKEIKAPAPKPAPVAVKKEEPKIVAEKVSGMYDGASDKEKKELEALKKDLEDISSQLRNKQ